MCSGSSRISSAVTPPRVAMDSQRPLVGGWTARRSESIATSVVSPRTRPWAVKSCTRTWAIESGLSSAATATFVTRRRSMANPPPPALSADWRRTSSTSQRLAAAVGRHLGVGDLQLVEPAHAAAGGGAAGSGRSGGRRAPAPGRAGRRLTSSRVRPRKKLPETRPTASRLPGLSGASGRSRRTTSVATGGSCSRATSRTTIPSSVVATMPSRRAPP